MIVTLLFTNTIPNFQLQTINYTTMKMNIVGMLNILKLSQFTHIILYDYEVITNKY